MRRQAAIRSVVKQLDAALDFGPGIWGRAAEAISDVALNVLVGAVVEWAYQELHGAADDR